MNVEKSDDKHRFLFILELCSRLFYYQCMKFPSTIILTTPRLYLRPFTLDDLDDFNLYCSTPGVGEMAGWPHHQSLDESLKILNMFLSEQNVLAIVDQVTNRVIGSVGVHASKLEQTAEFTTKKIIELGYVLSKSYWGRGLMVEACKAVIKYLFEVEGYEVLSCGHFVKNSQSRRVIEKLGFRYHSDDIYFAKQLNQSFAERLYILTSDTQLDD